VSQDERNRLLAERFQEVLDRIAGGADLEEEVLAHGKWLLDQIEPDELTLLQKQYAQKQVRERFLQLTTDLGVVVQGHYRLVTGETLEARAAQLEAELWHALGLWRDARLLFERGRFATATALAIVCLEETGKVGVARWQVFWPARKEGSDASRWRNPLFSHTKKHLLVAGQGALVNARLDRLLGIERVCRFLDDVESGAIEKLRQRALYFDHDGEQPLLPEDAISREVSLFYVVLAGELLAEVGGIVPETWSKLLDEVNGFEEQEDVRGVFASDGEGAPTSGQ